MQTPSKTFLVISLLTQWQRIKALENWFGILLNMSFQIRMYGKQKLPSFLVEIIIFISINADFMLWIFSVHITQTMIRPQMIQTDRMKCFVLKKL